MNNEVRCNGMGEMPGQEGRDSEPNDLAHCENCGTPVEEGEYCSKCKLYMPSGDDLADEGIRQMEAYDASLEDI